MVTTPILSINKKSIPNTYAKQKNDFFNKDITRERCQTKRVVLLQKIVIFKKTKQRTLKIHQIKNISRC